MSPNQTYAVSAGVFLTIVSVQVALARRGRTIGAVVFAVIALPVMTGVAFAMIESSARPDDLGADLALYIVRVSASFYGVVLLAVTMTALWLARRDPRPRASIHWAMTAGAGLLMYPLTMHSRFFQLDMMNAVSDGTGPSVVVHPTPEERLALAASLPDCAIRPLAPPKGKAWRWLEMRRFSVRLPLSNEMREVAEEDPDSSDFHQWEHERWGSLILILDSAAQYSPGFSVGGGPTSVGELACKLRVGSSIVPIKRTAAAIQHRGSGTVDSAFGASTDIPLALPDTQIGVGIVAHSRAGRDTLLSILAAIRFAEREKKR